ncbi:hypothetical protein M413DRAFT_442019 [Hebeloma cylindrosporum]|uniref:BTB domain-containing protein n=1 Tax=Hebeloma cylindrosporum TaxID=76867 RepID=A0A0C3C915_HEBCY|nr:hypothetical protein M413DRAFT_442019 [Hebeloma cylindrosporum h7]
MAAPKPPNKRRRTSAEDDAPESNLQTSNVTRSEDFWFEDGTIVLQAENTQFLVHKSVLSRHSVVFSDMFSILQPENMDDEPSVEGKPLVRVFDTAEDIDQLLRALYDRGCDPRRKMPFKVIEVMLRLGNKYDIPHFVAEATGRLHVEFPTTLSQWDVQRHWSLPRGGSFRGIKGQKGLLFDIVNLALQYEISSILPAAYFLCLRDIDAVLTGTKRDDGSEAILSSDAQRACIQGRDEILEDIPRQTFQWMDPTEYSDVCQNAAVCFRILSYSVVLLWKSGRVTASDAFSQREQMDAYLDGGGELCSVCRETSRFIHSAGRSKMWASLPSYFDLGSWKELEKEDPRKIVDG